MQIRRKEFVMYLVLSIITCGIYHYYWVYTTTQDINTLAGNEEQPTDPTMAIVLSIVTCGLYYIYWLYNEGDKIHRMGQRRGIMITDTGTTYLMWYLIGAVVCGIGSLVGMYKFFTNLNIIIDSYNGQGYARPTGGGQVY